MIDNNENTATKSQKILSISLLVILVIALVVMGFWAVNIVSAHLKSTNATFARDNNAPIPVVTALVEAKPVSANIVTQAILVENQLLPIYAATASLVQDVHVEVGSLVKKGQPLVTFRSELLKANVDLTKSLLDIAQEDYEDSLRSFAQIKDLFSNNLVGQDKFNRATLDEKQAKAKLANAQYALMKSQLNYSQVKLTAPVGGIVTTVSVFENTLARTNSPLMTISVTNPIYVEAKVAQRHFSELSPGQQVKVTLDAFTNQVFSAEVLRIGNEVDKKSNMVSVYAKLDNPDLALRPGMGGAANIELQAANNSGLRIPAITLLGSNGRDAYVFKVDNRKIARLTEVKIVGYEQGYVGIQTGLSAGDKVVVAGQQALVDGDKVEINSEL